MEGKGGEGGMGREREGERRGGKETDKLKLEYHSNQIGGGALAP